MKRPTKKFVTYDADNDPNHWTRVYPWNRKGTNVRTSMEQFFLVMHGAPGADKEGRREAIAWLESLLDKKPGDLFP